MEYCVREAVSGDKTAVLQINSNIYEGLDYLPEYFDFFQNCKHVTPYICTEKGIIIAYVACCRVDDGKTIVTRAARVSPEHQGKHVYKHLINEVETLHKDHTVAKYHALTKSEPPSESFLRSYQPVAAKEIHFFEYQKSNIANKLISLEDTSVRKGGNMDNIPSKYLSPPYCNYLFPEGRIIVDWLPFRPSLANIPLFQGNGTTFYSDVSLKETSMQQKTKIKDKVKGLLSASTIFKAHHDLDVSCNLDIFGTDFHSISEHLTFHLKLIQAKELENINLRVFTTKGFESSVLDKLMGELGVNRLTKGSRKEQYVELVVYEKPLAQ